MQIWERIAVVVVQFQLSIDPDFFHGSRFIYHNVGFPERPSTIRFRINHFISIVALCHISHPVLYGAAARISICPHLHDSFGLFQVQDFGRQRPESFIRAVL